MKALLTLGTALILLATAARAAGPLRTADATLFCASIAVHPAATGSGSQRLLAGYTYRFDGTLNDELVPGGPVTTGSYASYLLLAFPGLIDPITGEPPVLFPSIILGAPTITDADTNGVPDFFEVSKAVSGEETFGQLYIDDGFEVTTGFLTATWNRAAGDTAGTVRINVRIADFAVNATFTHAFEIASYTGTFAYRRNGDAAAGMLDVTRAALPGRITGTIPFMRTNAAELGFESASLTDQSGTAFRFESTELLMQTVQRLEFPTNAYLARLQFPESSPRFPGLAEYIEWDLVLRDANDADGDGTPDFSDDPSVAPPNPPRLRVALIGGQPTLTILGDVGARYVVETATTLSGFATLTEVTLTGAEAAVALPPNPGNTRFFRARAL